MFGFYQAINFLCDQLHRLNFLFCNFILMKYDKAILQLNTTDKTMMLNTIQIFMHFANTF